MDSMAPLFDTQNVSTVLDALQRSDNVTTTAPRCGVLIFYITGKVSMEVLARVQKVSDPVDVMPAECFHSLKNMRDSLPFATEFRHDVIGNEEVTPRRARA